MAKKTRKRFTAQEKVAILRLHLLEHIPISDLCDQHGIRSLASARQGESSLSRISLRSTDTRPAPPDRPRTSTGSLSPRGRHTPIGLRRQAIPCSLPVGNSDVLAIDLIEWLEPLFSTQFVAKATASSHETFSTGC
jgi:hypothetical protein